MVTEYAPTGVSWPDRKFLGPVAVRKWEIDPKGFGEKVTAEEWTLPDGSDLIELSIKISPEQANEASEAFMAYLEENGFTTEGDQQTKTRATLSYFTGGKGFVLTGAPLRKR